MPPATLMYASNNAVPGQIMYPVKRTLEKGILFLASLTPITKAYFSISQTEQRFNEVQTLLISGDDASGSLNEFVGQTEQAALDINNLSSDQEKYKLISELSNSIDYYQTSLAAASKSESTINYLPSNLPSSTPQPSHLTAFQAATQKKSQPTPTIPAESSQTTKSPVPTPITFSPPAKENPQLAALLEAQKKLEELKRQLDQQQKQFQNQLQTTQKPLPVASISPSPLPSPKISPQPNVAPSLPADKYDVQDSQSDLKSASNSPSPTSSYDPSEETKSLSKSGKSKSEDKRNNSD